MAAHVNGQGVYFRGQPLLFQQTLVTQSYASSFLLTKVPSAGSAAADCERGFTPWRATSVMREACRLRDFWYALCKPAKKPLAPVVVLQCCLFKCDFHSAAVTARTRMWPLALAIWPTPTRMLRWVFHPIPPQAGLPCSLAHQREAPPAALLGPSAGSSRGPLTALQGHAWGLRIPRPPGAASGTAVRVRAHGDNIA